MYRRKIRRIKLFIILIILVWFFIWIESPQAYIRMRTGFRMIIAFQEYHYDTIDEGKDFDALRVFRISQFDSKRLSDKVQQDSRWKPLPLPTDIFEGKAV